MSTNQSNDFVNYELVVCQKWQKLQSCSLRLIGLHVFKEFFIPRRWWHSPWSSSSHVSVSIGSLNVIFLHFLFFFNLFTIGQMCHWLGLKRTAEVCNGSTTQHHGAEVVAGNGQKLLERKEYRGKLVHLLYTYFSSLLFFTLWRKNKHFRLFLFVYFSSTSLRCSYNDHDKLLDVKVLSLKYFCLHSPSRPSSSFIFVVFQSKRLEQKKKKKFQ